MLSPEIEADDNLSICPSMKKALQHRKAQPKFPVQLYLEKRE